VTSQKVHLLRYAQASSLRRTSKHASFLSFRKPCIWSFLLCHRVGENLRVHQTWGIDFVLILNILFILVKGFVSSSADLGFL
jgi:hypothetical protein